MSGLINPYVFAAGPSALGIEFITSHSMNSTRNNYSGFMGFQFTTTQDMLVTHLGRQRLTGNAASHTVNLLVNSDGGSWTGSLARTVSVDCSAGTVGTWIYTACAPLVILSGISCAILSQELNAGDNFWDDNNGAGIIHNAGATIVGPIFADNVNGESFTLHFPDNDDAYVPPNFKY